MANLTVKPWGNFIQFCENKKCTVKILTIFPGEELSLQKHKQREEQWLILDGNGIITTEDDEYKCKPNDTFIIFKNMTHTAKAITKLKILEISFGHYDEEDIIRIKDKYKR